MSASRSVATAATALALLVAATVVVAPLAGMLVASLRVHEVVTPAATFRAVGDVTQADGLVRFQVASDRAPDETVPRTLVASPGVRVRSAWSLDHYRAVWASPRTPTLLANSLRMAAGATLLALLLGLPAGWLVARTTLPGRRLLAPLLAVPLLLPPFFVAMALASNPATPFSVGSLLSALGVNGPSLQSATASVCFGLLFFPVVALVAGRAMSAVPAGAVEAARLLAGPRAAFARVVVPAVLPSALAGAVVVFVLALADFAVPDLLGVFLPAPAVPRNVFATEVFLQWTKNGNVGRAVATGAPFVALTLGALLVAFLLARRGPVGGRGAAHRARPPVRLGAGGVALGWAFAALLLAAAVALPLASVASWGFSPARVPETLRLTPSLGPDTTRWLRIGLLAAAIATALAVALARLAVRGGRAGRAVAVVLGALPLAAPGMVLSAGTLLLWTGVPAMSEGVLRPALCLAGRTLPHALVACWLAAREVDPALEDAGRLLGAGPLVRAARVWGPLWRRGIVVAFLLALVLALRELDALVLLEPAVLPVRIYDKVHFGRTGQVADLSMLLLAAVLLPAVVAAAILSTRRGRARDVQ